MKNLNIIGVHRKIRVLGGGSRKPIYRGQLPKVLDSLQISGLAKKKRGGGWCFCGGWGGGGWYLKAHYVKMFFSASVRNLLQISPL